MIGCEGAKYISEGLEKNTTLKTLILWGNHIGDDGGKELFKSLKANTSLTHLDLGWNEIDNGSMEALGEILTTNKTMSKLSLHSKSPIYTHTQSHKNCHNSYLFFFFQQRKQNQFRWSRITTFSTHIRGWVQPLTLGHRKKRVGK